MQVAVVREARQPIVFEERQVPEPGPGQIRIKLVACGVCRADYAIWRGQLPMARLPIVPGHEVIGHVDALGPGVSGWSAGDRAGMPWTYSTCGRCDSCVGGQETLCTDQLATGVTVDGGFAPYLVAPAAYAARIPASLEVVEAAPLMCAGITVYGGLRAGGVRPGMTVAVQGIGGLGHLGLQYANALDANVVAVTRGEDKCDLARELGALETIDADEGDPGAALAGLGGADVILATAPSGKSMEALVAGLKPGGALVVVGASAEPLAVTPSTLLHKRARIIGSVTGTRRQMREALELAERHAIRAMVERYALAELPLALERLERNELRFRAVVVF